MLTLGSRRARLGAACLAGQRPGEAEPGANAAVDEAGDRRYPVGREGQHYDAVRVVDPGMPVGHVAAERGLSVRPGRDQPGWGAAVSRAARQEFGDSRGSLVLDWVRRPPSPAPPPLHLPPPPPPRPSPPTP